MSPEYSIGSVSMVLIARSLILAATIAGTVALTAFGDTAQSSDGATAYVRIGFSEKSSVFLEIQAKYIVQVLEAKEVTRPSSGNSSPLTIPAKTNLLTLTGQFRVAPTIEGLKAAPFKNGESGAGFVEFPEITLPIAPDQLPAGIAAVKTKLKLYLRFTSLGLLSTPITDYVGGEFALCRTNDRKEEWQYWTAVRISPETAAEKAPVFLLARLEKVVLTVEGTPGKDFLSVGARLMAGKSELQDVRRDGKTVNATVTVTDADGKQVASETRPFTHMGFS